MRQKMRPSREDAFHPLVTFQRARRSSVVLTGGGARGSWWCAWWKGNARCGVVAAEVVWKRWWCWEAADGLRAEVTGWVVVVVAAAAWRRGAVAVSGLRGEYMARLMADWGMWTGLVCVGK